MHRLINIDKEKYDNFVKNHKTKSHFLQSLSWGEFSKTKKGLKPYYLGLVDENENILAATLLLQKNLPMHYSYFYAPRGFVIDFEDEKLVKEFTKKAVKFVKSKKGIFLKIDPDIIRNSIDYEGNKNELSLDSNKVYNLLTSIGFKHLGFTKNFETAQPRYTFRIDLNNSLEEIEKRFSKTTRQRIQKANKLETIVEIGTEKDVDEFYHLMTLTENRKDFVSYSKDYYKTLYEIFNGNKNSKATLFLGKVNMQKTITTLEKDLKRVKDQMSIMPIDNLSKSAKTKLRELTRQKENLEKEIKKYNEYKKQYGEEITLNAHMIIEYGNKAWILYAGNHNILTETYANYHTYYEHIKYCKEKGIRIYDQFGTIGDLSKDNPRLGLHEFKKKFGGDYVEFLGEFDFITNKFMYFVFNKLVPIYRNLVRKRSKKAIDKEVSKEK